MGSPKPDSVVNTSKLEGCHLSCVNQHVRLAMRNFLFFLPFLHGGVCIRLTKTILPSHALVGEDVILECEYDMEGDKLYSVKWYRNGKEFYRHIPTDNPPTGVFRQAGLLVDEHQSTESRIVLRRVKMETGGHFQCEVLGEAPLFQTAKSSNTLTIVVL